MSAENNTPEQSPTKRKNNSTSSGNQREKKHIKIAESIKETDQLSCECSANKSIFFKIIHSKEEFEDFHKLNLEKSFNPLYTNQIFPNENISGYKGLKILISLTPKYLYPHIKIIYDKELKYHDNLDKLLQDLFKESYCKDDTTFLSRLEEEKKIKTPKGQLIYSDNKRSVYIIDILKDNFLSENWNFQTLCKFFIDGASFIYIQENFWNYFHTVEVSDSNWKTLGFCSYKNFHMALDKYSTMLSQFLVIPAYHRSGHGTFMLAQAYSYLEKQKECVEITTEDPCMDFILMRDFTIAKMMIDNHKLDDVLKKGLKEKNEIESKEMYEVFSLTKEEMKKIAKDFKLQKNLIQRAFEILKFALCGNKMMEVFSIDKKKDLKEMSKSEYDINAMFNNRKGPFIYFSDEPDYNFQEIIEEDRQNMNLEMTLEQKVEMLYINYERDVQKVAPKCGKYILEYKNNTLLNKK